MLLMLVLSTVMYLAGVLVRPAFKRPLAAKGAIACTILIWVILLVAGYSIGLNEYLTLSLAAIFFFLGLQSNSVQVIPSKTPSLSSDSRMIAPTTYAKPAIIKETDAPRPVAHSDIEINEDFAHALGLMGGNSACIFVTGKAGTGKSTLLRHFVKNTNKKVALLAPTGVAALNIQGVTIHSFFGFPARPLNKNDIKESRNRELFKALDTIIIDEISMVRADLLDAIDWFLRKNGRDQHAPFGGAQMIFFGDLFQLSPIVKREESKLFAEKYKSKFFFDAHALKDVDMRFVELRKVYRQSDGGFIDILNSVRTNSVKHDQLNYLNQRQHMALKSQDNSPPITLTTTNSVADTINQERLEKIAAREFIFTGIIEGEFKERELPTMSQLRLKKGSQVMFVKNDLQRRWVNGTIGQIESIDDQSIAIRVPSPDGRSYVYPVEQEKWEVLEYKYDSETQTVHTVATGAFTQYPVKLAWAITIHKSQGLTFDKVIIDLGSGAFTHGQTYVALSRCTSLEGIALSKPITRGDIRVEISVVKFMKRVAA